MDRKTGERSALRYTTKRFAGALYLPYAVRTHTKIEMLCRHDKEDGLVRSRTVERWLSSNAVRLAGRPCHVWWA